MWVETERNDQKCVLTMSSWGGKYIRQSDRKMIEILKWFGLGKKRKTEDEVDGC